MDVVLYSKWCSNHKDPSGLIQSTADPKYQYRMDMEAHALFKKELVCWHHYIYLLHLQAAFFTDTKQNTQFKSIIVPIKDIKYSIDWYNPCTDLDGQLRYLMSNVIGLPKINEHSILGITQSMDIMKYIGNT